MIAIGGSSLDRLSLAQKRLAGGFRPIGEIVDTMSGKVSIRAAELTSRLMGPERNEWPSLSQPPPPAFPCARRSDTPIDLTAARH